MSDTARFRSPHVRNAAAATLLLALGPVVAQSQPAPSSGPMRVTTDTPEYCEELSERVSHAEHDHATTAVGRHAEVAELAEEGHQMCATGLIRGGLLRLRRAWMMLRSEN